MGPYCLASFDHYRFACITTDHCHYFGTCFGSPSHHHRSYCTYLIERMDRRPGSGCMDLKQLVENMDPVPYFGSFVHRRGQPHP